jgi:hypothetical protein
MKAYTQGATAKANGYGAETNPYYKGTICYYEWRTGWFA